MNEEDDIIFKQAMHRVTPLGQNRIKTHQSNKIDHQDIQPNINHLIDGNKIVAYARKSYQNTKDYVRLKKDLIDPDISLDLHNHTVEEVKQGLLNLLTYSKHYCICIIHGKGLHNQNNSAIIKSLVIDILKRHNRVLAYHSRSQQQGGAGATCVILNN
jgi:DNA-nicking Smr family endonuclease